MGEREWKDILARYGQKVTLCQGEERREIRAFLQPVEEKAPGQIPTPLGVAPAGKWLFLGPPEEGLEKVDKLLWQGRGFEVLRDREFPMGDTALYRWGVLIQADEVEA